MPVDLSFYHSVTTDSFYTRIHQTMVDQSKQGVLPPTSQEFAAWLTRKFSTKAETAAALDCGCGVHAFNTRSCRRLGFRRVEAIDVDPDVIGTLRRNHEEINFTSGSVLELPFSDAEFDLVICSGVAHHTPNPARAFREITRVLKPGGVAYISLYAFRRSLFHLFVRAIRSAGRMIPYRIAHRLAVRSQLLNNFVLDHMYVPVLWLYTAAEARNELLRAGLMVEQDFSSNFDVFSGRPFGRLISGDGLLRVFICRKPGPVHSIELFGGTRNDDPGRSSVLSKGESARPSGSSDMRTIVAGTDALLQWTADLPGRC
jgi:SAM-dependent methyltransferase